MRTGLGRLLSIAIVLAGVLPATGAAADGPPFSVRTLHFDTLVGPSDDTHCDVVADLYTPASATAARPAPAVLTTNGFGGSKDDQKSTVTQPGRLVAPIRPASTVYPVEVTLPAFVHRFAAGHRIRLVVAGSDAAYRGSPAPAAVTIATSQADPGLLTLPVVG